MGIVLVVSVVWALCSYLGRRAHEGDGAHGWEIGADVVY